MNASAARSPLPSAPPAGGLESIIYSRRAYDKANHSSAATFRGPGLDAGLEVLARIRRDFQVPVLTDVHTEEQVRAAAAVVDVLQIPAFLCRQTDLIDAAVRTGKIVNVKKGQFLSPQEMGQVVRKATAAGGKKLLLTERGTTFGYNNLVADMRSIPILRGFGFPVVFDATHSGAVARRGRGPFGRPAAIRAGAGALRGGGGRGWNFSGNASRPRPRAERRPEHDSARRNVQTAGRPAESPGRRALTTGAMPITHEPPRARRRELPGLLACARFLCSC